jgi:hypothetical protein
MQKIVLEYLTEFSQELEKVERKLKLAKSQKSPRSQEDDLIHFLNTLRTRTNKVAKFLQAHHELFDLAETFSHKAEKLNKDLQKTLEDPKSLSSKIITGLQSLQKTILGFILSFTHKPENQTEPHEKYVSHVQKRPNINQKKNSQHAPQVVSSRNNNRHSFPRSGKGV